MNNNQVPDPPSRTSGKVGGGITFVARRPKPEESRHREVLDRLDALSREVALVRRQRPNEP
jgi:hypothetical protein